MTFNPDPRMNAGSRPPALFERCASAIYDPLVFRETPVTHAADALRIGVVVSRYHTEITAALARGAEQAFIEAGGSSDRLTFVDAPGAFELPVLAEAMAESGRFDAIVTIGCVITGETSHDRYICESIAHALQRIALEKRVPVAFGVLTCQTIEQAKERSGGSKGNKGAEAMIAAINAAGEIRRLRELSQPGSARGGLASGEDDNA